jgi:GxxExxY protein
MARKRIAQRHRERRKNDKNDLSGVILNAAITVHKELDGPGLIEPVYEKALAYELQVRGVRVERKVPVPIIYKGQDLGDPLCLDLLVEDQIVVECKAVEVWNRVFLFQVLTYLRLKKLRLGLVINFGAPRLLDSFHRVVNNL